MRDESQIPAELRALASADSSLTSRMIMPRLLVPLLIVYLMCSTNCQAQEVTAAPARSKPGKIAFMSDRDGNWEIYTITPDGTVLNRLTNNSAEDRFPTWSPDGRSVAFVSNRDTEDQLYVIDSDGAPPKKMTDVRGPKAAPCWAPDGDRLAFVIKRRTVSEIHLFDRARETARKLCNGHSPAWSPDGTTLVAISGNLAALVSIDVTTGKVTPFFSNASFPIGAFNISPKWSPDGKSVMFGHLHLEPSEPSMRQSELYIANADGSDPKRLTKTTGWEMPFDFSPDGSSIVFGFKEKEGEEVQLYIMSVDGKDRRKLTTGDMNNSAASWSPYLQRDE